MAINIRTEPWMPDSPQPSLKSDSTILAVMAENQAIRERCEFLEGRIRELENRLVEEGIGTFHPPDGWRP